VHGAWKARRETSGSTLLMGGCHAVDLLRWFMGMDRKIVEVFAYGNGPYRRKEFEFLPNLVGVVKFKDGGIGKVGCSLETSMPYVFHYQFMGAEGCIRNDKVFLMSYGEKKTGFRKIEGKGPDDPDVSHHPFPEEIQYFIDCIKADREPDISIQRCEQTYRAVFALEKSAEAGGKVIKLV
jgi:predicted dehydrogenase